MIYLLLGSQFIFSFSNPFQNQTTITLVAMICLLLSTIIGTVDKKNHINLDSPFLNFLVCFNLMCCLINSPLSDSVYYGLTEFILITILLIAAFILSIINSRKSYLIISLIILSIKCLIPIIIKNPNIDVYTWMTEGTDFFLSGANPYEAHFSDMGTKAYGYDPVFAYFPGTLFFLIPFRILRIDIRFASVIADLLISFCFYKILSFLKIKKEQALMFSLYIYTLPCSFFVIEKSWTEPFVLLSYLVSFYLILASRKNLANVSLGFLLSIKQYCVFLVPFLWVLNLKKTKKYWASPFFLTSLTFTLIVLPFFLWNKDRFTYSTHTVFTQLYLRKDSLTFLPTLKEWGWASNQSLKNIKTLTFILAAAFFILFTSLKSARVSNQFCIKITVALFGFIYFFGDHAFYNIYYLFTHLLILSQLPLNQQTVTQLNYQKNSHTQSAPADSPHSL